MGIFSGANTSALVTAISAADTSVTVAGTAKNPTIATGTLDVIATNHAAAAAVPLNAQKITGLASGTAATDAAAFGQVVWATLFDSTLTQTAASFDATGLSQAYKHLRIVSKLRSTTASTTVGANLTFNADSAGDYDYGFIQCVNTIVVGAPTISDTVFQYQATGANAMASSFGSADFLVNSYTDALFKNLHGTAQRDLSGTAATTQVFVAWCLWRTTAAITRVTIAPSAGSWDVGSRLTIYGF